MFWVFILLFLLSLILVPIGLIKPSWILRGSGVSRKKFLAFGGGLTLLFFILSIATVPSSSKTSLTSSSSTPVSEIKPTVASQEVLSPTPGPKRSGVLVKVVNVVDGDTIKIETGETVRYIGIDTPEVVHPSKPIQCYGKEASQKNQELVEGKIVELERDISEKDKYGRLLRYIWIDNILVNEYLVREGYAQSSSYPPDIKYQDRFVEAQRLAREEQKGLWSSMCAVTSTVKPTVKPQSTSAPSSGQSTDSLSGGSYICDCSKTCSQMSSCAEAQYQLNVCGCSL
ncbi:MAG: WD40 domain protein beta Propeller [Candidatus Woesebacteria bacterium GW2011_GWB1_38_5b]|uniref:WD40 domain protein beta Propeller n=1 Tax=Candidatus Woesebacteria bacterium GW2011_GWB1_38_5b TaxID=1618569 RepID=A0A0G0K1W7_9BACT|nr:MAG: WD40 domain protein beta Propeller [Candidatus Woesebacteria bacterium GW2011_GWB1_38_5b]